MKSATTNIYLCLLSAVVIVVNDFLFELQIECCCLLYLHCNLWDLCDASCALDGAKVCAWSDYCMTCVSYLGSDHQQYWHELKTTITLDFLDNETFITEIVIISMLWEILLILSLYVLIYIPYKISISLITA